MSWIDITDPSNWEARYFKTEDVASDAFGCGYETFSDPYWSWNEAFNPLLTGYPSKMKSVLASDPSASNGYSWDGSAWVADHDNSLDDATYDCGMSGPSPIDFGLPFLRYIGPDLSNLTNLRLTVEMTASYTSGGATVVTSSASSVISSVDPDYMYGGYDRDLSFDSAPLSIGDVVTTLSVASGDPIALMDQLRLLFCAIISDPSYDGDDAKTHVLHVQKITKIEVDADPFTVPSSFWTDFSGCEERL